MVSAAHSIWTETRFWLTALLCVLLCTMARSEPVWVTLDGAPEGTPPTIVVESFTTDATTLQVIIHGFWSDDITTAGSVFKKIALPRANDCDAVAAREEMSIYSGTNDIGKSSLPVVSELIGTITSSPLAQIVDLQRLSPPTDLPGYRVYPYAEPVGDMDEPTVVPDTNHYMSTDWYPFDPASPPLPTTCDSGDYHALHVVGIPVSSFFVIPAAQLLRVYTISRITVSHVGPVVSGHISNDWELIYTGHIANLPMLSPFLTFGPRPKQLRVYIGSSYRTNAELTSYTIAKEREGFTVTTRTVGTVPLDDIANSAASIYNDIKTFYDANPCNDIYVLLVGDVGDITSQIYTDVQYSWCASDYKYALMGNDVYADLFVGRLPCDSSAELTKMLKKIRKYHETPPPGDWFRKVDLACYYYDDTGYTTWTVSFQECCEAIRKYNYAFAQPVFNTRYGSSTTGTVLLMTNDINSSYGMVNYQGHGAEDAWSKWDYGRASLGTGSVVTVAPGDYAPIVFAVACHNGDIGAGPTPPECINEIWLKGGTFAANTGAVAAIGASEVTWRPQNNDFDKAIFKKIFDSGLTRLGPVLLGASGDMIRLNTVPGKTNLGADNAHKYLLLGDPTMHVRTRASQTFDEISAPNPVNGAVTYTVKVKSGGVPVPGATVCIEYTASPLTRQVGVTNSSGQVSFPVSVSSETRVTVIVTKADYTSWEGQPTEPVAVGDWQRY